MKSQLKRQNREKDFMFKTSAPKNLEINLNIKSNDKLNSVKYLGSHNTSDYDFTRR